MNTSRTADTQLAVYGSLAPGRANAHELAALDGRWIEGRVRGHLVEQGWGATMGYPAIVLANDAPMVPVMVLQSDDLPRHWDRLDAFEGEGYSRVVVPVETEQGTLAASIYVLADEAGQTLPSPSR